MRLNTRSVTVTWIFPLCPKSSSSLSDKDQRLSLGKTTTTSQDHKQLRGGSKNIYVEHHVTLVSSRLTCIFPLTKVVMSSSLSKIDSVWSRLASSHSQCSVISFLEEPTSHTHTHTPLTAATFQMHHSTHSTLLLPLFLCYTAISKDKLIQISLIASSPWLMQMT